jgi:hypothetical protein
MIDDRGEYMKKFNVIAILLMLCMSALAAFAGQKPVNISAEANSAWCGVTPMESYNCSTFPSGKQKYNGITFDIPTPNNGWFAYTAAGGGGGEVSVTIPVKVKHVQTVYTLMNSIWGSADAGLLSITFTGSNGVTWTYDPVEGSDLRDFNNGSYINTIDCLIAGGLSQVGTVTAFSNGEGQRLDMQIYELPASFQGQTLESITITDNGNTSVQRSFIAAVTVSTSLP